MLALDEAAIKQHINFKTWFRAKFGCYHVPHIACLGCVLFSILKNRTSLKSNFGL